MKSTVRIFRILCLSGILMAAALFQLGASGQAQGQPPPSSQETTPQTRKAPVQGYTRTNKHTGQPEQVRSYKRQRPTPKPVQVKPHMRGGKPVGGYERQPPARPGTDSAENKKAQAVPPLRAHPVRWLV